MVDSEGPPSVGHEPWPWELEAREQFKVPAEELEEAQEWMRDFAGLTQHPGWLRLMDIVDKNLLHTRREAYELKPLADMNELPAEQFNKGEISGIRLVIGLPAIIMEQANEIIEIAKAFDTDDEDEEN